VTDGTGAVVSSTCDGGRLRASGLGTRVFRRPASEDQAAWAAEFKQVIASLGTDGSSYEGGLEAARRAVGCSVGVDCDDPLDRPVADLNRGFVRPEADLVVVFLTDEDDCSFADRNTYAQPFPASDVGEQAAHVCQPNECYAHYGASLDDNSDGLMDWADPVTTLATKGLLQCGPSGARVPRSVNPPAPRAVEAFLDGLTTAKGGDVTRIRAAGILGAVASPSAPLGHERAACVGTTGEPSRDCGCLAGSFDPFLCALTGAIGQSARCKPPDPPTYLCVTETGGCGALPGGRYLDFLQGLSARREAAFARADTLVDSICRAKYDQTMYDIVNSIILQNCFSLGVVPASADDLSVTLNGETLPQVEEYAESPGFSYRPGSSQICLEGGLRKSIGDEFEILLITSRT